MSLTQKGDSEISYLKCWVFITIASLLTQPPSRSIKIYLLRNENWDTLPYLFRSQQRRNASKTSEWLLSKPNSTYRTFSLTLCADSKPLSGVRVGLRFSSFHVAMIRSNHHTSDMVTPQYGETSIPIRITSALPMGFTPWLSRTKTDYNLIVWWPWRFFHVEHWKDFPPSLVLVGP